MPTRAHRPISSLFVALTVMLGAGIPAGCKNIPTETAVTAFGSDAELRHYLARHIEPIAERTAQTTALPQSGPRAENPAPVAQIREGDIVQPFGDNLVILRRSQVLTVSLRGGGMRPIDAIGVYPPNVATAGIEEDMLIAGNLVIITGYDANGALISRFRITEDGRLQFADAHELRMHNSGASWRAGGSPLLLYSEIDLTGPVTDPLEVIPTLRRLDEPNPVRIANAQQIHVPIFLRNQQAGIDALQMVVICDIAAPAVACQATGILGPRATSFYVSASAIYVSVDGRLPDSRSCPTASLVYRLAFDSGTPTATRAGNPLCPR